MDFDSAIADRVRSEREARTWSIADLADRSGVSKAMISRIERAETNPTAALLVRIATAFGFTLASFFARIEDRQSRLSPAAAQSLWTDPDTGYTRRQILASSGHPVEISAIHLPPGQTVALPAASYMFIRQAIWVISGSLEVTEGKLSQLLECGDCLAFGPPSDVILANPGPEVSHYLVVLVRN